MIGDIPEGSDSVPSGGAGGTGGAGGVAGSGGTALDGSAGAQNEDAAPDAGNDVAVEGSAGNAGSGGPDAQPDAPTDSGCAVACDCDGDGQTAKGSCGGKDCDDSNPNVFEGQTKFFAIPRANGSFDYDCNDAETPQQGKVQCVGALCVTKNVAGLYADPVCGAVQQWATCTPTTLGCNVTPSPTTTVQVLCH